MSSLLIILSPFQRPDVKSELQPGDTLVHLCKVGSDYATGHGKLNQKTNSNVDMNGSHNSGFQTLLLYRQSESSSEPIFKNNAPGGSQLLRLFSKTAEKDSQERMIAEMERLEKISKEIPEQVIKQLYFPYPYSQVVQVPDVGAVVIRHHLVNSLHDGKERLAMTQHMVKTHFDDLPT